MTRPEPLVPSHLVSGRSAQLRAEATAQEARREPAHDPFTWFFRLVREVINKADRDRLLGLAFGFARAVLVLLATTAVLVATPVARSEGWRHSTGARWLEAGLAEVRPLLPFDLPQRLRTAPAPPHPPASTSRTTRT